MHYESKTAPDFGKSDSPAGIRKTYGSIPGPPPLGSTVSSGTKKAALFAWTTLQSIPEETVISPHILEFLEQTLEPIPTHDKSPPQV